MRWINDAASQTMLITLTLSSVVDGIRPRRWALMTRDEQLATRESTFIPLYLKFHKTGSGFVADVMRRHSNDTARRVGVSVQVSLPLPLLLLPYQMRYFI